MRITACSNFNTLACLTRTSPDLLPSLDKGNILTARAAEAQERRVLFGDASAGHATNAIS